MKQIETDIKKIAVITMSRNDEFFLNRWIKYYGQQFGEQNLYIYLDGTEQKIPSCAGKANIKHIPHKEEPVQQGDKTRILLLSNLAKNLFDRGYEIVIGCDCDEFLIIDPALNISLPKYLSNIRKKTSVSGLGLDVGQDLNSESTLNPNEPLLEQRSYALLSTRYTKPVVLFKPSIWGSGFHSVKGRNFHIDKNLYLLHFGSVDYEMIKNKVKDRNSSWKKHLKKRTRTIEIITQSKVKNHSKKIARLLQTLLRPIYDINKPAMLGLKWVTKIPDNFKKINI